MDARRWVHGGPRRLEDRIEQTELALSCAKVDFAMGRLTPHDYARLSHDLDDRLRGLEAQRLGTLMKNARRPPGAYGQGYARGGGGGGGAS